MRTDPTEPNSSPRWMRLTLLAAAVYNIAWGAWVVIWPAAAFSLAGMDQPRYPELWQCIGMVVGAYGLAYAAAARDPLRHWPVVLAGLAGKVLGPIGMLHAVMSGALPAVALWVNVFNDLVWLVPFSLILWHAWRKHKKSAAL